MNRLLDGIDRGPKPWQGRDDGPGADHARWWSVMDSGHSADTTVGLIGFACHEGVRRNMGRLGAADGPEAIRGALGSLKAPGTPERRPRLVDHGDVVVVDEDLEGGHDRLGRAVAASLDAGELPVVLGGGHEVAYGTYRGVAASQLARGRRHGVFNVDAHFDLRRADRPSSGTPFLQMFDEQRAAEKSFAYAVAGISPSNNTQALFDTAAELGVDVLLEDDCSSERVEVFVDAFLAGVDLVHLTIDLDAMPASAAPGVSAPAAFGVPVEIVRRMSRRLAASGKVAVIEVAEMNPTHDIDGHTARLAARLIDEFVRTVCC